MFIDLNQVNIWYISDLVNIHNFCLCNNDDANLLTGLYRRVHHKRAFICNRRIFLVHPVIIIIICYATFVLSLVLFRSVSVQRSQLFFPRNAVSSCCRRQSRCLIYKMIRYGVMKNKITAVDLSTTFFSLVFYMYFFHQFIIHKKKVYKV